MPRAHRELNLSLTAAEKEELTSAEITSPSLRLRYSLEEGARAPRRAHPDDAGLDLSVLRVTRRGPRLFFCDTGVRIAPPAGYYSELIPRSSIVWRGFIMPNSVGVIDAGYRGSLLVPLLYQGAGDDEAAATAAADLVGERIAQLILRRLEHCELEECSAEALGETTRGEGRFGSTSALGDGSPQ